MDLLDECLADLGTRRVPTEWASVAGPLVERQHVKQQRRQDLASGSFPEGLEKRPKDAGASGLEADCAIRRRDTHQLAQSSRSARASRAESIAQQLKMKLEPIDTSLSWLSPEEEHGPIEYKYKINNPHPIRLQQLITQMKFRLSEGAGQCFYYVGVEDDGYPKGLGPAELDASIATLHNMSRSLRAHASLVRVFPGAHGRQCALIKVQRGTVEEVSYTDLRVAVAGCVDAGKSTLVAVLTHGANGSPCLDTGRGSARVAVLRHKHEIESGRTSSLSQQLLGYDREGKVLNYNGTSVATMSEVASVASKVLTFIDMGGHEKCLKTALYGMTALLPDYALLCCCAVRGLGRMSREHLAVAVALQIPTAVIITKTDMVDEAGLEATIHDVRALVALAWPSLRPTNATATPAATAATPATTAAASADSASCSLDADLLAATPVIDSEQSAAAAAQSLATLRAGRASDAAAGSSDGAAAATAAAATAPAYMCPILLVSCVTGRGLDCLHAFLSALQPARPAVAHAVPAATASAPDLTQLAAGGMAGEGTGAPASSDPTTVDVSTTGSVADLTQLGQWPGQQTGADTGVIDTGKETDSVGVVRTESTTLTATDDTSHVHFQVDHTYDVANVGSVVAGMVVSGFIQIGQRLLLGPTKAGDFMLVEVTGIQRAHIPVRQVRAGQAATLALSLVSAPAGAPQAAEAAAPADAAAARAAGTVDVVHEERDSSIAVDPGIQQPAEQPAAAAAVTAAPAEAASAVAARQSSIAAAASVSNASTTAAAAAASTPTPTAPAEMDVAPDLLELFEMDNDDGHTNGHTNGHGHATGQTNGHIPDLFGADDDETPRDKRGKRRNRVPPNGSAADPFFDRRAIYAPGGSDSAGVGGRGAGSERKHRYHPLPYIPSHTSERRGGASRRMQSASWCESGGGSVGAGSSFDMAILQASRSAVEACNLATSVGAPSFLRQSSPSAHRGAVLLGAGTAPRTAWSFQAVLVLLGGHWPPRGLLSGCWPPVDDVAEGAPALGAAAAASATRAAAAAAAATAPVTTTDGIDSSSWCGGASNSCSEDMDTCVSTRPSADSPAPGSRRRCSWTAGYQGSITTHVSAPAGLAPSHAADASAQAPPEGPRGSPSKLRVAAARATVDTLPVDDRADAADGGGSPRARRRRTKADRLRRVGSRSAHYTTVIHCANVRQLARLTHMQELPGQLAGADSPTRASGPAAPGPTRAVNVSADLGPTLALVTPSMRAAASLLHAQWEPRALTPDVPGQDAGMAGEGLQGVGGGGAGESPRSPLHVGGEGRGSPFAEHPDLGCLVMATFRFEHRPEWLRQGSRLVVRDRSTGHVSAAGYVSKVMLDETDMP